MSPSSTSSSERRLSKPIRALLWLGLLLVLAELGLRGLMAAAPSRLPTDARVHIALGSSRTMHGVMPVEVEAGLAQDAVEPEWVANVSVLSRTVAGLVELYENDVRPQVTPGTRLGTLAIEVRAVGMNDHHLLMLEQPIARRISDAFSDGAGDRALSRDVSLNERLGALLVRGLYIADLRTLLDQGRVAAPPWVSGDRGWKPSTQPVQADKRVNEQRTFYLSDILRQFSSGGVQSDALRHLIREARLDGWEPVLFIPPVMPVFRSFFAHGWYEGYRANVQTIAEEEAVTLIDFDAGAPFPPEEFLDVDHLNEVGAAHLSRCFARAVIRGERQWDPNERAHPCAGVAPAYKP